jgi:UDP:flavonoid glycosyltransferase YjiC (YdhE family)
MISSKFAVSVREAYGLERSWKSLSPPACELAFLLRELQVGDPEGDVPRFYIGPTMNERRRFEPSPYTPGYALVTFGTLSNNQTERFEAAIKGAFQAGLSVVAQCGRKVDVARLKNLARALIQVRPAQTVNIIESVPDLEALIASAKLVIHHAGLATTWETVRFRKPALFIPTIADQKVLSGQLEALGVGHRLPAGREFDAGAIAKALESIRVLRCPWEKVETLLANAGGAKRGVEQILEILEKRG